MDEVYIEDNADRYACYFPLSAKAHFLLQRRLEVAQEALKPFARRADHLDQTEGWLAANRRESIYDLAAVMRARDVLLEQKVWDHLPEADL